MNVLYERHNATKPGKHILSCNDIVHIRDYCIGVYSVNCYVRGKKVAVKII